MNNAPRSRSLQIAALFTAALSLGGCTALDRFADIGREPSFEPILNPTQQPDYAPVNMPMPVRRMAAYQPNSLWRAGARAFFKDQRASQVGDIVTVEIEIADKATIKNQTTRTRDNTESANWNALFGYEQSLNAILPEAVNPGNILDLDTDTSNKGTGEIKRDDQIDLKIAAVVVQVLPNGNLVIDGDQEVRVNFELRELKIRGVVRPEDITSRNTVSYEKIANARIAYGGRGQITDVQQPRWGSQVLDVVVPF